MGVIYVCGQVLYGRFLTTYVAVYEQIVVNQDGFIIFSPITATRGLKLSPDVLRELDSGLKVQS